MPYHFNPSNCTQYKKFVTAPGVFTPEECAKICAFHVKPIDAGIRTDGIIDINQRKSRVSWLHPQSDTMWIYQRLERAIFDVNKRFWNYQLSRIDALQLTEYTDKGHYNWHEDMGEGVHGVRKLSLVIQLTDPTLYAGGDLLIFPDHKGAREQGAITVFPSYVTHKVCPVDSGTRMSLVAWIEGNAFI